MTTILVLNPNSSEAVTDKMRLSGAAVELAPGQRTQFHTLAAGPAGIQTQRDVERVVIPTCDFFHAHPADAYVIGCFSDPGLHLARAELAAPVFGIAEEAYRAAASGGRRFGVVSLSTEAIARHARYLRELDLAGVLAGDRAIDLGVLELLDAARTIRRVIEVGRVLRDTDGAAALVLGCATMGAYCAEIAAALDMPVIDPTQAAVARASAVLAGRAA